MSRQTYVRQYKSKLEGPGSKVYRWEEFVTAAEMQDEFLANVVGTPKIRVGDGFRFGTALRLRKTNSDADWYQFHGFGEHIGQGHLYRVLSGRFGVVKPVDQEPKLSRQDLELRWEAYTERLTEEAVNPGYFLASEPEFKFLLDNYYHEVARLLEAVEEPDTVGKLLYTISHLDREYVVSKPELLRYTARGLKNSNVLVQQLAVGAYERWRGALALESLHGFVSSAPWLSEYVNQIQTKLAEELSAHGFSGSENH